MTGPRPDGASENGPNENGTGSSGAGSTAGPFGEEAARLLGAAQDWLHRTVLDPATARVATGSAECCWCPLCQLIVAARGERPELAERLSAGLADLQTVLAGLLRSVTEQPDRPARTVHKIDLDDTDPTPDPG